MAPWQAKTGSVPENPTYERPLGITEQIFYFLHSSCCSATDTLQNGEIETLIGDVDIFHESAVSKAWILLKHKHPLLGAQIQKKNAQMVFVVEEERIKSVIADEITFLSFSTLQEVRDFEYDVQNNKNLLSSHLLTRLFIIARTDVKGRYHVLTLSVHAITDGVANSTILRSFLDLLTTREIVPISPLESRLALCLSNEDLGHTQTLSVAVQRWRFAVASIIVSLRDAKSKGGQTLPRRFTKLTERYLRPAVSRRLVLPLSPQQSTAVIDNCRKLGFTFGAAYPVIGQIAMARVLARRRTKGEIDSAEWEFRRAEPMTAGAPVNIRPFLNEDWYRDGGFEVVSAAIGFFFPTLGILPLGAASRLELGGVLPTFDEMLSRERFLHRCLRVKKQATEQFKHPLFLDISTAKRIMLLRYFSSLADEQSATLDDDDLLSALEQSLTGSVPAFGGSSFGNRDKLLPLEYPLRGEGSTEKPKLRLMDFSVSLRCRPGELYLGAVTIKQHLQLLAYWDENAYTIDIVEEWLQEVKAAVEHYLL